jgi:hypothetical protein
VGKLLSIVIPSKTERFLEPTIRDVLAKATGEIEVFPVLDGYELPPEEIVRDPRVEYVHFPSTVESKKRQAINYMVEHCNGDYVMSLDAHCMMAPGFDEALIREHQPDWVSVPRRHRLDPINWSLQPQCDNRPPIDYEYLMWPMRFDPQGWHGFKWDARTLARQDVLVDDIITFQGSCWMMTKDWFRRMSFMDLAYQGWGQEAEEISFTTWGMGGRCVVNKHTWYAHLHKGPTYGRMYHLLRGEIRASSAYAWDFWRANRLKNSVHNMQWLIDKFWPLPGWSSRWRELVFGES